MIVPISGLVYSDVHKAGQLAVDLCELKKNHINMAEGYVVTYGAFVAFLKSNNLTDRLHKELGVIRDKDELEGRAASERIRNMLLEGDFPQHIEEGLTDAFDVLGAANKATEAHSLIGGASVPTIAKLSTSYSSTINRDVFLNIKSVQELKDAIKLLWGSIFSPYATHYRETEKIDEFTFGVLIGPMPNADFSGLVESVDMDNRDSDIIKAWSTLGYGELVGVRKGEDISLIDKESLGVKSTEIGNQEKTIKFKNGSVITTSSGGIGKEQKLNDRVIQELGRLAKKSEQVLESAVRLTVSIHEDVASILAVQRLDTSDFPSTSASEMKMSTSSQEMAQEAREHEQHVQEQLEAEPEAPSDDQQAESGDGSGAEAKEIPPLPTAPTADQPFEEIQADPSVPDDEPDEVVEESAQEIAEQVEPATPGTVQPEVNEVNQENETTQPSQPESDIQSEEPIEIAEKNEPTEEPEDQPQSSPEEPSPSQPATAQDLVEQAASSEEEGDEDMEEMLLEGLEEEDGDSAVKQPQPLPAQDNEDEDIFANIDLDDDTNEEENGDQPSNEAIERHEEEEEGLDALEQAAPHETSSNEPENKPDVVEELHESPANDTEISEEATHNNQAAIAPTSSSSDDASESNQLGGNDETPVTPDSASDTVVNMDKALIQALRKKLSQTGNMVPQNDDELLHTAASVGIPRVAEAIEIHNQVKNYLNTNTPIDPQEVQKSLSSAALILGEWG